jgi:phage shock protein A
MAQSILGRVGQLVRANVNAMLDSAEDPERMLDQLIRDYTINIREAESAVAQTIGNLRLLEEDQQEAVAAVDEWGQKALAASGRADSLRAGGQTAEAERFDNLARVALRRQIGYEEQARTLEAQVRQQRELTDQLKEGLDRLRVKLQELVQKRDELVGRAKVARAQVQVQQAVRNVSVLDPTSELSRFEDRVRHEEALARGLEEVAADRVDEQFARLDADEDEQEVEARFARLKAGQPDSAIDRSTRP